MLNYPHNPTAAVADLGFFEKVIHFAKKHNLLFCHDLAYPDMTFDGYKAPSALANSRSQRCYFGIAYIV